MQSDAAALAHFCRKVSYDTFLCNRPMSSFTIFFANVDELAHMADKEWDSFFDSDETVSGDFMAVRSVNIETDSTSIFDENDNFQEPSDIVLLYGI